MRVGARRPSPWSFDPARIARHERDAWVAYYRRDWRGVLRGAHGMVREGFGMGPLSTLRGAWLVLRANRVWAPYPDNDPDLARRLMGDFYALVARRLGLDLDPAWAATLEVAWWHEHRVLQREDAADDGALVDALTALYSYVYSRPPADVRAAAAHRAAAMCVSDDWVADGCRQDDPRLAEELADLERSYEALLRAVGRTSAGRRV